MKEPKCIIVSCDKDVRLSVNPSGEIQLLQAERVKLPSPQIQINEQKYSVHKNKQKEKYTLHNKCNIHSKYKCLL